MILQVPSQALEAEALKQGSLDLSPPGTPSDQAGSEPDTPLMTTKVAALLQHLRACKVRST